MPDAPPGAGGRVPRCEYPAGRGASVSLVRLTVDEMLDECRAAIEDGRGVTVSYMNFHTANLIEREPALAGAFGACDLITPEGILVIRALRWLGYPLTRANILSAEFLVPPLLREAIRRGWPVALVGGAPGVADRAAENLREAFPGVAISCVRHGHFASSEEGRRAAEDVARAGSRVILVAMGQPRQERWIAAHRHTLGAATVIAVGGYFDKISRHAAAYPAWVYTWRLFWLYRLLTEPRALWRRYLVGGPRFVARVLRLRLRHAEGALRP